VREVRTELDLGLAGITNAHSEKVKEAQQRFEDRQVSRQNNSRLNKTIRNCNKVQKVSKKMIRKIMTSRATYVALAATAIMVVGKVAVDANNYKKGTEYMYDKLVNNGTLPPNLKFEYDMIGNKGIVMTYEVEGQNFYRENVGIQDWYNDVLSDAMDDGNVQEQLEMVSALHYAGLDMGTLTNIANVDFMDIVDFAFDVNYVDQNENLYGENVGRAK